MRGPTCSCSAEPLLLIAWDPEPPRQLADLALQPSGRLARLAHFVSLSGWGPKRRT